MADGDDLRLKDGAFDWSGGIDSEAVPTIQSQLTPNGLARNELAWLNNATVRDGGISPRNGWNYLMTVRPGGALYQCGLMYDPGNSVSPYLMVQIGGHIYKCLLDGSNQVTDLSTLFGNIQPANLDYGFAIQAEQFAIFQAGDGNGLPNAQNPGTRPLFWDNVTLKRSLGITNTSVAPGTPNVNQIPSAKMMDYYMDRLWYASSRSYYAGDIFGGNSGVLADKSDAILNVTENPLVLGNGGDGFRVPSQAGDIRVLTHSGSLNTALGQGQLYVGTRKAVYALSVPVTRTDWIAANSNSQPLQTLVAKGNGPINDRSTVAENSDLYFQSLEPSIRSLNLAIQYFNQPGNRPISANENRILQFNDRSLLRFASGITFQNRLWQTALPKATAQGCVHQAIIPLDYEPISSFGAQYNPVWEGMYEGIDILQMFTGDFQGVERAFALATDRTNGSFQIWEFTGSQLTENGDNRITWFAEFPAFTAGKEYVQKELDACAIFYDKLFGSVDFELYYRPDQYPCYQLWKRFPDCAARNCAEDISNQKIYPCLADYQMLYGAPKVVGRPPAGCNPVTKQPFNQAFQFQILVKVTGYCRLRGLMLYMLPVKRAPYQGIVC